MAGKIAARLAELGIELPAAAAPVANYVPFVRAGNLVFVSGQIPVVGGAPQFMGRVGNTVSVAEAIKAARLCGINLIAQARAACGGDLDRLVRVVRLGGFVSCEPEFIEHPKVLNGASDLMVEVFGDAGRHSRVAVGCSSLPLGVPVEIDGVFEIS